MKGWNLQDAVLTPLPKNTGRGVYPLGVVRKGAVSNRVPFALDTLPEILEQEPNSTLVAASRAVIPVVVNGRIDQPGDWDVYEFSGKAHDVVVAEVHARRLDSPLDSVIKLMDARGTVLAYNDDHEGLEAGLDTHAADSHFSVQLPADGPYFVHIGDTARQGGEEYGYRLRISAPEADF